jgi:hypothetical protein
LIEGADDLHRVRLHLRKANLERLLAWRPIFVNPFERGEIGPDLFRAACRMGRGFSLEASRAAIPGRSLKALVKVNEPKASGH